MAITTTKTNIMTLIQEDGGDPTGAGGKLINDNFAKIDELFSGDNCRSAMTLTQAPAIAQNTGFSNPAATGAGYRVTSGGVHYPVAIWGTEFQTGNYPSEYGNGLTVAPIAQVPPYGPFAYRVMATIIPNNDQGEDTHTYLEFIVHGENGNLHYNLGAIVYPTSTSWELVSAEDYDMNVSTTSDYYIGVTVNNGTLYCGGSMPSSHSTGAWFACVMHVTVLSLYSNATTFTDTNIYYHEVTSNGSIV